MSFTAVTLPSRGAIIISGNDTRDFLQNLITQDIDLLDTTPLVYSCLLTPQGKFLHDFFIRTEGSSLILDCEGGARIQDLHKRLSMYKLRSAVELELIETTSVWQIFSTGDHFDNYVPPPTALKDPRHDQAGWRYYGDNLPENDIGMASFATWEHHRITLEIPDGSRDLVPERSFIHEGRLDEFNAVSYTKGCYVGQELVSRMHHRGLSKKQLKCVNLSDLPEGVEPRSTCGDIGLAVVKL